MNRGFEAVDLSSEDLIALAAQRKAAAADILRLTWLAGCGHPGGSLSTLDALLLLYRFGKLSPDKAQAPDRDRVIISHGHISPGVYATLAQHGYFAIEEAYRGFRRAGSVFGGHVENCVPGVEWNTGNLGQGLSAGCAMAFASGVHQRPYHVFVGMGDGEQQKGQVSEARRFAAHFRLSNLIAFIDVNGLQIGGDTQRIMAQRLQEEWEAAGWNVLSLDGHDHHALYTAFRCATRRETPNPDAPTVLLLRTVMGKGVSFIENDAKYHGQSLTSEQVRRAFAELGVEDDLDALLALRAAGSDTRAHHVPVDRDVQIACGTPRTYDVATKTDCRSAYGDALLDLAQHNKDNPDAWPIIGISCDLEGSVKMNAFHKLTPARFVEAGIQEHHSAVFAGALSKERCVPFFSTFGMFGIVEVYNQQRLNDQNSAAPRVVVTHCGLDVGEDGPTHQCIDYIPLAHNLFGAELYAPADPNETDRIIRYVASRHVPAFVTMGRSKLPTLATPEGQPALAGDFQGGRWITLREGNDAVVFAFGAMVWRAVAASDRLAAEGIQLRVVNASSLKPIDKDCILKAAKEVGRLLTYEDHNVHTGLGALVASTLGDAGIAARLRRLGVQRYGTSGPPDDLFAEQGLATEDLMAAARELARADA